MKYLPIVLVVFLVFGCSEEALFSDSARHDLWLFHEGAKLPIVVEGNTNSKVFVVLLHGGPGGSAQIFNADAKVFSDAMEETYAMVYYDQRNAGLALGEWNESALTIEQSVEDLDKVIDLLYHKFGNDIQVFLAGHSWGGYLGTAYLLESSRAEKLNAFVNINGMTHRNLLIQQMSERIEAIATEQIFIGTNTDQWSEIIIKAQAEQAKGITQYDKETEDPVFDLMERAENQIDRDQVLVYNSTSPINSIYTDNYDPFRIIINSRKGTLPTQIYAFDKIIDSSISNITLPTLSIYGYYDMNTPMQQGEFLINGIGTNSNDKKQVILRRSGHSSMQNEADELAVEMKSWIEQYR